jgi:hypothetical protein
MVSNMTVKELRDALDAYLTKAPEAEGDYVYLSTQADHQVRPVRSADYDYFGRRPIFLLTDEE